MKNQDVDRLRGPAVWVLLGLSLLGVLYALLRIIAIGDFGEWGAAVAGGGGLIGPAATALPVGAVLLATKGGPLLPQTRLFVRLALAAQGGSALFGALAVIGAMFSGLGALDKSMTILLGLAQLALLALAGLYTLGVNRSPEVVALRPATPAPSTAPGAPQGGFAGYGGPPPHLGGPAPGGPAQGAPGGTFAPGAFGQGDPAQGTPAGAFGSGEPGAFAPGAGDPAQASSAGVFAGGDPGQGAPGGGAFAAGAAGDPAQSASGGVPLPPGLPAGPSPDALPAGPTGDPEQAGTGGAPSFSPFGSGGTEAGGGEFVPPGGPGFGSPAGASGGPAYGAPVFDAPGTPDFGQAPASGGPAFDAPGNPDFGPHTGPAPSFGASGFGAPAFDAQGGSGGAPAERAPGGGASGLVPGFGPREPAPYEQAPYEQAPYEQAPHQQAPYENPGEQAGAGAFDAGYRPTGGNPAFPPVDPPAYGVYESSQPQPSGYPPAGTAVPPAQGFGGAAPPDQSGFGAGPSDQGGGFGARPSDQGGGFGAGPPDQGGFGGGPADQGGFGGAAAVDQGGFGGVTPPGQGLSSEEAARQAVEFGWYGDVHEPGQAEAASGVLPLPADLGSPRADYPTPPPPGDRPPPPMPGDFSTPPPSGDTAEAASGGSFEPAPGPSYDDASAPGNAPNGTPGAGEGMSFGSPYPRYPDSPDRVVVPTNPFPAAPAPDADQEPPPPGFDAFATGRPDEGYDPDGYDQNRALPAAGDHATGGLDPAFDRYFADTPSEHHRDEPSAIPTSTAQFPVVGARGDDSDYAAEPYGGYDPAAGRAVPGVDGQDRSTSSPAGRDGDAGDDRR